MRKKWSKDELDLLVRLCDTQHTYNDLMGFINRGFNSIYTKCRALKIDDKVKNGRNNWNDAEIDILKSCNGMVMEDIQKLFPDRSYQAINGKMSELKIKREDPSVKNKRERKTQECSKCHTDYLYNDENYYTNTGSIICKPCINKISRIGEYKRKHGIILDFNKMYETYSIIEWYTFLLDRRIDHMPYFMYTKENITVLLRYGVTNILKLNNKKDIAIMSVEDFKKIKLFYIFGRFDAQELIKLSFPEYEFTDDDFNLFIGCDNKTILDSKSEKKVFDFIYSDLNIKTIKGIGRKRKGKYVFKLPKGGKDKMYCPDFVIENITVNNQIILLPKPLIIEYYGLFNDNSERIYKEYSEKTLRKNDYYNTNQDIYFLDIYPKDLNYKMNGVREKLTSFLMSNFNISIT